jgi:hypothetical protein
MLSFVLLGRRYFAQPWATVTGKGRKGQPGPAENSIGPARIAEIGTRYADAMLARPAVP